MGAMGVDKGETALRFICIPTAINSFFNGPFCYTHTLPYPAQLSAIILDPRQALVGDSTDLLSAFNLFVLPKSWKQLFVFSTLVPGHLINDNTSKQIHICMNVLPMGWLGSVDAMQGALHFLMFQKAQLNPAQNVTMSSALPETETWLLAHIDGLDTVRRVPISLLHQLSQEGSPPTSSVRRRLPCLESPTSLFQDDC